MSAFGFVFLAPPDFFRSYVLERVKLPYDPVEFKGTFDTGPQGDFCTRDLCRKLQEHMVAFYPFPNRKNSSP